jgi:hypothetical protein
MEISTAIIKKLKSESISHTDTQVMYTKEHKNVYAKKESFVLPFTTLRFIFQEEF